MIFFVKKMYCIDIQGGRFSQGWIEPRVSRMITDFQFIKKNKWTNSAIVIIIQSIREFKNYDRFRETASRYYIYNLEVNSEGFQDDILVSQKLLIFNTCDE